MTNPNFLTYIFLPAGGLGSSLRGKSQSAETLFCRLTFFLIPSQLGWGKGIKKSPFRGFIILVYYVYSSSYTTRPIKVFTTFSMTTIFPLSLVSSPTHSISPLSLTPHVSKKCSMRYFNHST